MAAATVQSFAVLHCSKIDRNGTNFVSNGLNIGTEKFYLKNWVINIINIKIFDNVPFGTIIVPFGSNIVPTGQIFET